MFTGAKPPDFVFVGSSWESSSDSGSSGSAEDLSHVFTPRRKEEESSEESLASSMALVVEHCGLSRQCQMEMKRRKVSTVHVLWQRFVSFNSLWTDALSPQATFADNFAD